jgi:hypothetical protein
MKAIAKLPERFSETAIDGEIVVMRLDDGDFFALTGTGAAIWRSIDGRRSRDDLVTALAGQFATAPSEIAGDIDAFLARLKEAGLIAAE